MTFIAHIVPTDTDRLLPGRHFPGAVRMRLVPLGAHR